jgi:hypothetical protein
MFGKAEAGNAGVQPARNNRTHGNEKEVLSHLSTSFLNPIHFCGYAFKNSFYFYIKLYIHF